MTEQDWIDQLEEHANAKRARFEAWDEYFDAIARGEAATPPCEKRDEDK